jgi:hypothetical protein
MYTLDQANELQQDFAYIISCERRVGMEISKEFITSFFNHGGVVREYYQGKRIEATMPKDNKYLALKAKYFSTNSLSIFYPNEFKKHLDNDEEV